MSTTTATLEVDGRKVEIRLPTFLDVERHTDTGAPEIDAAAWVYDLVHSIDGAAPPPVDEMDADILSAVSIVVQAQFLPTEEAIDLAAGTVARLGSINVVRVGGDGSADNPGTEVKFRTPTVAMWKQAKALAKGNAQAEECILTRLATIEVGGVAVSMLTHRGHSWPLPITESWILMRIVQRRVRPTMEVLGNAKRSLTVTVT